MTLYTKHFNIVVTPKRTLYTVSENELIFDLFISIVKYTFRCLDGCLNTLEMEQEHILKYLKDL